MSRRDPEQKLWDDVRTAMTGRWHAQRHEDKYSKGIPDVSFGIRKKSEGWIELKVVRSWPPTTGKPWDLSYDHFPGDQRNWLTERARHGPGRVFLMCRFGDVGVAIWSWARLGKLLGQKPFDEVVRAASAQWWHEPIDPGDLERVLADNRIIPPRFRA